MFKASKHNRYSSSLEQQYGMYFIVLSQLFVGYTRGRVYPTVLLAEIASNLNFFIILRTFTKIIYFEDFCSISFFGMYLSLQMYAIYIVYS